MAETERFELSVPNYQHDGLANRWFQPLTHVSGLQHCLGPIAGHLATGKGASIANISLTAGCNSHSPYRKSDSSHRRGIAGGLTIASS